MHFINHPLGSGKIVEPSEIGNDFILRRTFCSSGVTDADDVHAMGLIFCPPGQFHIPFDA